MRAVDIEYANSKYCFKCGKEFLEEIKEQFGFSRIDAKPVYKYSKRCPEYNDMQFGLTPHDYLTRYDSV